MLFLHRFYYSKTKMLLSFLLPFVLSQTIRGESITENVSPHATVNKGVFLYQRKDVILFNDYHPFTVIVDLPKYAINKTARPCDGDVLLCTGYRHAYEYQRFLAEEVFESNPYITGTLEESNHDSHRVERGLINLVGYINKFLFGIATSDDVDALHGDVGNIAIKINQMIANSQQYMFQAVSNVSAYSIQLSNLVASGLNKFEKLFNKQNHVDAIYLEMLNTIMVNLHLQSVSQLLNTAASDCRNELIPRGIITDKLMNDKLQSLGFELTKHSYVISASLNQLLKLKVARCVFAKEKVEVTIKIPIRRAHQDLKLYHILHTPYVFENQQCRLDTDVSFIVMMGKDMVPITKDMQPYCNPNKDKLCMVAEFSYFPSPFSSCAEAFIGSSQKDIVSKCVLKCSDIEGTTVTQLSSTEFVVTSSINITVECNKMSKKAYSLEPVGSVLLELGCGCSAIVKDDYKQRDLTVKPSYPCVSVSPENQHDVTHILPAQMSNLRNAIFEENSESYSNISEIVNEDWQAEIPTLHIEPPKPIQFSTDYIAKELTYSYSYSTSIIYVWLSLLTVAFVALGAIFVLNNGRGGSSGGFGMLPYLMIFSPTFGLCADIRAQKTVTFNDSIWALVQALEIMNVICWAVEVVFVLGVLVFMYKSMKNVRICNRLLRAFEDGNFL